MGVGRLQLVGFCGTLEGGLSERGHTVVTPAWMAWLPVHGGWGSLEARVFVGPCSVRCCCVLYTCLVFLLGAVVQSECETCSLLKLSLIHHCMGTNTCFPNVSLAELTTFLC